MQKLLCFKQFKILMRILHIIIRILRYKCQERPRETHTHTLLLTRHFSYAFVNGCKVLALVESGRTLNSRIAQTVQVSLLVMTRTTVATKQTVCTD